MNGRQRLHRFHLEENSFLNDYVGAVRAVDSDPSIDEWKWLLGLDSKLCSLELVAEARQVSAFQQSRAERPVNSDRYAGRLRVR